MPLILGCLNLQNLLQKYLRIVIKPKPQILIDRYLCVLSLQLLISGDSSAKRSVVDISVSFAATAVGALGAASVVY